MRERSKEYPSITVAPFNLPFSIEPLDAHIQGIRNGRIIAFVFEDPLLMAPISQIMAAGVRTLKMENLPMVSNMFNDYEDAPLHTEEMDNLVGFVSSFNCAALVYYRWNGRIMPLCLEEDANVIIKLSRGTRGIVLDVYKNQYGSCGVFEVVLPSKLAPLPPDIQADIKEKTLQAFERNPDVYSGSDKLANLEALATGFYAERTPAEKEYDISNNIFFEDYMEIVSQTFNNWATSSEIQSENGIQESLS